MCISFLKKTSYYQVHDFWFMVMVSWIMHDGSCYLLPSVWSIIFGVWFVITVIWFLVVGFCLQDSMVGDFWWLVLYSASCYLVPGWCLMVTWMLVLVLPSCYFVHHSLIMVPNSWLLFSFFSFKVPEFCMLPPGESLLVSELQKYPCLLVNGRNKTSFTSKQNFLLLVYK